MTTAIIIILVFIFGISVYQLIILKGIKKNSSSDSNFDVKYFELKYQTESYVKIFSVLIALAGFLGYNTFVNTKKEIESAYIEPIKKYESKIDSMNNTIQGYESFIKTFNLEKAAIQSVLLKTGQDAKSIEKNINLLASSKINQLKIYVVPITMFKTKTYYFKDLKTHQGGSLPKFKKTPFLQIMDSEDGMPPPAIKITNESFHIDLDSDEELHYNAWILSEE